MVFYEKLEIYISLLQDYALFVEIYRHIIIYTTIIDASYHSEMKSHLYIELTHVLVQLNQRFI